MKKLLALVLILSLAIPALAKPSAFNSIKPLQWANSQDKSETDVHYVSRSVHGELQNHCTVYKMHGYWQTDAHCVLGEDGDIAKVDFYIAGKRAYVVRVDVNHDLAELKGGPAARDLMLSVAKPQPGDQVYSIGYPFGWDDPIYVAGLYSGSEILPGDESKIPYAMYQLPVAPGDSGSPVLTKDGMVVGQVQITLCGGFWSGFCPIGGSATYDDLKAFIGE